MKNPATAFILHILFLFILYTPSAKAANNEASKLANVAFKAASDKNFKLAKDSFGRLATIQEQELLNMETPVAMRNQLNVALYRVLESVSDDALNKRISETGARNLTTSIQISKHYPRATIWLLKFTKLLKGMQNYSNANFVLGRLYFDSCFTKKENCEEGMKEHQAALKNDPKFVYSYFSIGRMHLWKKQMKQAGDAYVKALSLSSSNGMKGIAHASLVAIYGQQKLWAEANKHLKIATSLGMSIPENIAGVIKLNAPNREKSIAKGTVSIESATSKKMLPEIKILMIGIQHGKFKLVSDYFSSYVTKLEKEGLKKTKAGWLIALSSEIGLNQVLGKVADDVINKKIGDKIGKELLVAGMAYKEKKTDTAILINRSTLKKIENYAGARFLLGRFYTKNCLSKNKNCEEALKEHKFALTYNQDLIYSYLDMASIYTHKKQSKEAIRIYEKLLSMPSNDLIKKISHISLAKIYSGMTIWPKANKHLNRAIALGVIVPKELQEFTQIVQTKKWKNKNSFVEAMKMRAFKAGYNGNFKAAQAIFSSLAATEEEMLESANILTSMGNLAIIGYFRVLEQVSKDALEKKISTKAAKLLFEATKLAGAQLKDGISLTSNTILSEDLQSYPSAHFLLGRLFFINCAQKERNCEESLKEHRTALKHDPKLLYSYLDMGKVYRKMKKANETIKIYEKASSLPSSDRIKGIIHFELTKEYGQLMKGTKAQEHLQKSVSLGIVVPKVMTDIVNATVQMEKKSINGTIEGWTLAFRGKGWAPNFYFKSGILSKTGNKVLMPVLVNYKSAKKIGSPVNITNR